MDGDAVYEVSSLPPPANRCGARDDETPEKMPKRRRFISPDKDRDLAAAENMNSSPG